MKSVSASSTTLPVDRDPRVREVVLRAIERLSASGATDASLDAIGRDLGALGQALAPPICGALFDEVELFQDPDGTFELVVTRLRAGAEQPVMLAFDTWSIHTPCFGVVRVDWSDDADAETVSSTLDVGSHRVIGQGKFARFAAAGGDAELLRLYGVARQHLPSPSTATARPRATRRSECETARR